MITASACPVATICSAWAEDVIMPTAPVRIPASCRMRSANGV